MQTISNETAFRLQVLLGLRIANCRREIDSIHMSPAFAGRNDQLDYWTTELAHAQRDFESLNPR